MRWAGHVARMGEKRSLKERDYLEDLSVCGRTVLRWSLKNQLAVRSLDLSGLVAGCWERGGEPGSVKSGEFLGQLTNN